MLLGINRLGQAAIVMRHALATGIPFAPEKDGRSFLSGFFPASSAARHPALPAQPPPTRRTAGPSHPEWPPASGQDSQQEADPGRYPQRVLPPADDADPAATPGQLQPADVPHGGGAAPDLEMLARLTGEWLAPRRQRGRRP